MFFISQQTEKINKTVHYLNALQTYSVSNFKSVASLCSGVD